MGSGIADLSLIIETPYNKYIPNEPWGTCKRKKKKWDHDLQFVNSYMTNSWIHDVTANKCSSQPFQPVFIDKLCMGVSIGQLLSDDFAAVTTGVA